MAMLESTRRDIVLRAFAFSALILVALALPALGQSRPEGRESRPSGPGTGDPDEHLVPWRFLSEGGPLLKAPLVLYWLPASRAQMEHSTLLNSRALLQDSDRCLGLEIVLPDDVKTIDKLGAAGKLPEALLVDLQGSVVRRTDNRGGELRASSVEQMVRDELNARDETMYARMTEARQLASNGDKNRAVELYQKLWDERCLFPLAGKEAQRALKDLGVIVVEAPAPPPVDPNLTVVPKTTTAPPRRHV